MNKIAERSLTFKNVILKYNKKLIWNYVLLQHKKMDAPVLQNEDRFACLFFSGLNAVFNGILSVSRGSVTLAYSLKIFLGRLVSGHSEQHIPSPL